MSLRATSRLFFPAVEAVDVAALVELFDEARVDEVLGLGGFRFGILEGELVQNRFQPLESRILFGGQLVLVDGAGGRVRLEWMNRFSSNTALALLP